MPLELQPELLVTGVDLQVKKEADLEEGSEERRHFLRISSMVKVTTSSSPEVIIGRFSTKKTAVVYDMEHLDVTVTTIYT